MLHISHEKELLWITNLDKGIEVEKNLNWMMFFCLFHLYDLDRFFFTDIIIIFKKNSRLQQEHWYTEWSQSKRLSALLKDTRALVKGSGLCRNLFHPAAPHTLGLVHTNESSEFAFSAPHLASRPMKPPCLGKLQPNQSVSAATADGSVWVYNAKLWQWQRQNQHRESHRKTHFSTGF